MFINKKMKELIAKTNIKREKGWLYYTGTDEEGFITLWKSESGRNKKRVDEK